MSTEPKIRIPEQVKKGEIFPVKAMIKHSMQNGRRLDKETGEIIPRLIINKFICKYNGREAFAVDLHTSMSANPYFSFFLKGAQSGKITFEWVDDNGESISASRNINVQ